MTGYIRSSKLKAKVSSSIKINKPAAPPTLTSVRKSTQATPPAQQAISTPDLPNPETLASQINQPIVVDLVKMVKEQDQTIKQLTKRVELLEQALREIWSQSFAAASACNLLLSELDKLTQLSRRSRIATSGVDLTPGNETTEQTVVKVRRLISKKLNVSQEDFDYESGKIHRHPTKPSEKNKKPPAIICKFRSHQLREHLFTKNKGIYNNTNRKINFHVSLTRYRSDLLPQANLYLKENRDDGQVKFYLADANRNLKIKLSYNRNVKFDTVWSFLTGHLET